MNIDSILSTVSSGYLLRQVSVILLFGVLGYVFLWAVGNRPKGLWRLLLAFPAGLAFFCTGIFSMLVVKIRINPGRLVFVLVFAFFVVFAISVFYRKKTGRDVKEELKDFDVRQFLILLAVSLVTAFICCSGIFSVSLDNDSFYYFSEYPQILIEEGDLKYEFDVFLTDVGLMSVIVNAIPAIFGFMNSFGIQHFLNINFLCLFFMALYTELDGKDGKRNLCISAAVTLFLVTCPAYLTTAKWVMAGDYFMVFFFIVMYLGYKEAESEGSDMPFALMLFSVMLSQMRQEGPVMAAFLVLCLSVLKYDRMRLSAEYMLPLIIASGYYYLRIFVFLKVEPLYAFLTRQKAAVIMAGLFGLLIYIVFIRDKLPQKLKDKMILMIPGIFVCLNLAILAVSHRRYLANLYAFFMNIRLRNGWGYFGYFFFIALVIAFVLAVKNKALKLSFFDMVMTGYILAVVCASWGRGDVLRVGTGDSGNRVMLTAVPVITFAMTLRLFNDRSSRAQS